MAQLGDYIKIKHGYAFKGDYISTEDNGIVLVTPGNFAIKGGFKENKCKFFTSDYPKEYVLKEDDLIVTMTDLSKDGDTLGYSAKIPKSKRVYLHNQRIGLVEIISPEIDKDYLYWFMRTSKYQKTLVATASGSTVKHTSPSRIYEIEIDLPNIDTQKSISKILNDIENKIIMNNAINSNLEQQMQAIFINMFGESIDALDECDTTLSDLVESVDNRGKTPPLSPDITNYPIIDVRALSGSSRIIDYNNCSKFVDEETYNNWFRSGHPQPYDILISTVGSLAEMKIFLGTVGCIAQNVVGFRCKQVSPLYIYQYLNYIKNDLVAYNIGSVQPSIKVTHIIKHHIFLPDKCEIDKFDAIAREMTNQIYANCKENENLTHLRDTLLLKLMSGVIDLSNIAI